MSKSLSSNVLVVGGGIAGIQSALDLTELGFKVYLVEKKPTIGGTMAQLDKTFPTLDCSLCILAPKMVEVYRNPNIELITFSQVKSIEGSAGNYTVKILKKPRYVKEDLCKGCGECASVCPVRGIPNEFDANLKDHAAAYIPFPSSVPPIYLIDSDKCLFLNYGICKLCSRKCSANAIDFSQKSQEIEINVGAIVIATGYEQRYPDQYPELAGDSVNVISSMQFERLLSANGPTSGELMRLDDRIHPHSIAFLQCVGSRDFHRPDYKKYCSAICCMSSAKQAIIAKEHAPETECYIFNTEIRAKGKNFYEFIEKSKEEYGIKYVNGRVSSVKEDTNTRKLKLFYEDLNEGVVKSSDVDMVVLASALFPNDDYYEFLKKLNVKQNEMGFISEDSVAKCEESNIFFPGYARKPRDIPTAVVEGSACAAKISERLFPVRFQNFKSIKYPPEIIVNQEDEPRVGVLVCRCGINIAGVVDVKRVVNYVSKLPYIVHVEENMYSCSSDSQKQIITMIEKYNLNRFIVASCTPRTHEMLFRNTLREAGLNPFLFELVNIRDQDSWVHQKEPKKATQKACDLIRMNLAKVVNLKPLQKVRVKVEKSCLIIGGGVAGIFAANNLAKQGFEVYLVDKNSKLGGKALDIGDLFKLPIHLDDISKAMNEIQTLKNCHLILESTIIDIYGYVGNFMIKVKNVKGDAKIQEFKVGTIIVAIGTSQSKTVRWQDLSNKFPGRIITQNEFEAVKNEEVPKFQDATIILCVDQRRNECNKGELVKTYCSNICCLVAMHNIEKLLAVNPKAQIHVLYRELQLTDLNAELLCRNLRKKASFERYKAIDEIIIEENKDFFHVKYKNVGVDTEVDFNTDLIILATPELPAKGTAELSKILKVPTTKDGFFLEAHVKLKPIDFATEGIYLCGSAHWPTWVDESVTQAYGAAGRAAILMAKGEIETEGITSWINEIKCIGCGRCAIVCPYNAIEMIESEREMGLYKVKVIKAHIINAVCKGCGTCVAECQVGAIDQNQFTKFQIKKTIDLLTGIDLYSYLNK